jgi:hypothetical protein
MPVYKSVNKKFFKTWTPDMAYVLGFFAADGTITVTKRGGQYWSIQITDKELIEGIRSVIESTHAISVRQMRVNEQPLYRLQIGSREMCDDLRALGFSERKAKSMGLPLVPEEYLADFIRGYFDGDGNVWVGKNNTQRVSSVDTILSVFTSSSNGFLLGLQECLRMRGLGGGSLYSINNSCHRLSLSVSDSLKLYEIMYNTKASESLYLQRKKDVFEQFSAMRP